MPRKKQTLEFSIRISMSLPFPMCGAVQGCDMVFVSRNLGKRRAQMDMYSVLSSYNAYKITEQRSSGSLVSEFGEHFITIIKKKC